MHRIYFPPPRASVSRFAFDTIPGQSNQFGLRRPVENPRPGGVRIVFALQRRLEPLLDELLPSSRDSVDARVQRRRDRAIAHPSPPSDTSAFSRMRALVSSCAELLPARINASSRSRSSMVNFTTYFLPAISFPATNHLHRCIAATEIQRNTPDSRTRATRALADVGDDVPVNLVRDRQLVVAAIVVVGDEILPHLLVRHGGAYDAIELDEARLLLGRKVPRKLD